MLFFFLLLLKLPSLKSASIFPFKCGRNFVAFDDDMKNVNKQAKKLQLLNVSIKAITDPKSAPDRLTLFFLYPQTAINRGMRHDASQRPGDITIGSEKRSQYIQIKGAQKDVIVWYHFFTLDYKIKLTEYNNIG